MIFRDRDHAGELLARALVGRAFERPVIYALPRGGVPVARHVADALHAPLELLIVRKIGVPWQPELAAGAVADGGHAEIVFNEEVMASSGLTHDTIEQLAVEELQEIERRRRLYSRGSSPVDVSGRDAIVVDDGIATGATFKVAIRALRRRSPARVILATPVGSAGSVAELRGLVDDIVCLSTPVNLYSIGAHYSDFRQLTDQDVIFLLDRSSAPSRQAKS
jgi:putative phosphoribosyl transferase